MSNLFYYVILICIFLILSAFFSGMEAAIFSISRFRVKSLLFERKKGAVTLEKIKRESGKTLASILLANLLVNVAAASVATIILIHIVTAYNLNLTISFIIEFIIMTSLLLILGEITPKTIAIANAESLALKFGKIIEYVSKMFMPISSLMEKFTKKVFAHQTIRQQETISDKEIKLMLSEAKKFKILDEGEEEFGYQILRFGKMKVSEVMTPRQKVIGVKVDASIEDVKSVIKLEKHSRICVFDTRGDVAGIIYAKDLFVHDIAKSPDKIDAGITGLMREPYIVPETKHLDNLLGEFRKNGVHISVVVDEFGNFSGIVTLEDILESLFGEIIDEYDEVADLPYKRTSPNTYVFEGDISIGELSRILHIEPFTHEGERLSGFILNYLKKIPNEKEKFIIDSLEITIEEIHNRIIEKVMVRKI